MIDRFLQTYASSLQKKAHDEGLFAHKCVDMSSGESV